MDVRGREKASQTCTCKCQKKDPLFTFTSALEIRCGGSFTFCCLTFEISDILFLIESLWIWLQNKVNIHQENYICNMKYFYNHGMSYTVCQQCLLTDDAMCWVSLGKFLCISYNNECGLKFGENSNIKVPFHKPWSKRITEHLCTLNLLKLMPEWLPK